MSLKALLIPPVPEETARVAHAVFPHGNVFMQVRDALGTIYTDEAFADLFPTHGQPAFPPWRLALVTVFQFMENLMIGKLPTLCAIGWPGNMRSAWN
jgi:transposase